MSKRAEQAALTAYPSDIYSGGKSCRRAYKDGYEQAEKDTIERAWEWLTSQTGERTFEDFRKAMEEE